jgi:hypothetical protein
MTRIALLLICLLITTLATAQIDDKNDFMDGTFAIGKNEGSLSVQYARLWGLTKSNKLSAGIGLRLTSYLGANQYYITAPAEITSGSNSPFILFKENIIENIDSLLVESPQVTCLNVSINIHYQFSEKFRAGFNIDGVGFSFGGKKQGNYINGSSGAITNGKPTSFNVLLISDNDLGSLNSELFVRYQLSNKLGLKLGASFLFTEYTTNTPVQTFPEDNDRFRRKSLMLALGASYKLK